MKSALSLLLILSFALLSCKNENSEDNEDKSQEEIVVGEGPVIVSFKNSLDIDTNFKSFSARTNDSTSTSRIDIARLFYDDTQATLSDFSDKPMLFNTLTITSKEGFLVFRHAVNFFDANECILQRGDSVQVEYIGKQPQITIQNRKTLKYDISFDSLARSYFKRDKYSFLSKYREARDVARMEFMSNKKAIAENESLTFKERGDRNHRLTTDVRRKHYAGAKVYLSEENSLLDSLKSIKELSTVPYSFYKERNKYLGHMLDMQTDRLAKPPFTALMKAHQVNRFGYPDIYYQQFLEAVSRKYIEEKADYVDNNKPSPLDYRKIFDQIDTSSLFPRKDRDYLLTKAFKNVHETFSHDDFITYFKKYKAKVKDTTLVNTVRNDFALEFDNRRSETASLVLTDISGKKLTFEEVKARNKGKVVYVDFWASWCAPCRQAMPASADLRKALKGKDVVFVYLSIDASITPWKKASTAEKLDNHAENYLVVNTNTSDFLKQNKLSSIPRYMIFDKTGRLTHANAPRVESGGVGLLLTTLADKQ